MLLVVVLPPQYPLCQLAQQKSSKNSKILHRKKNNREIIRKKQENLQANIKRQFFTT